VLHVTRELLATTTGTDIVLRSVEKVEQQQHPQAPTKAPSLAPLYNPLVGRGCLISCRSHMHVVTPAQNEPVPRCATVTMPVSDVMMLFVVLLSCLRMWFTNCPVVHIHCPVFAAAAFAWCRAHSVLTLHCLRCCS